MRFLKFAMITWRRQLITGLEWMDIGSASGFGSVKKAPYITTCSGNICVEVDVIAFVCFLPSFSLSCV